MEYISSFTYCDSIQNQMTPKGPRYQIINPLQVLAPVSIPGNYSFSISCNVAGFDGLIEHNMKLEFCSPKGAILYDTGDMRFQIPREQVGAHGICSMQFNLDIRNLVFMEEGMHISRVYFDGKELGNYKIQVILGTL